jgi:hypothetical protein
VGARERRRRPGPTCSSRPPRRCRPPPRDGQLLQRRLSRGAEQHKQGGGGQDRDPYARPLQLLITDATTAAVTAMAPPISTRTWYFPKESRILFAVAATRAATSGAKQDGSDRVTSTVSRSTACSS